MALPVRIQRFSGPKVKPFLPDLARLRISVFREYPYLYEGTVEYEERYLKTYTDSPGSVVVVAFDVDRVVGASTGLPLEDETDGIQRNFGALGYEVSRFFYFGESVLERGYRGQGIGVRFFEEREAHALSLGRFDYACFCAVARPAEDPRRPPGYVPLDRFWVKRGYRKHPELRGVISWQELGETEESPKTMEFWIKALRGGSNG